MNAFHRWYCRSGRWRRRLYDTILPGLFKDVDLGDDPLEIGPGPGITTDWLRQRVPHLTAIEIDRRLAASLEQRLAGSNVTVIEGDAAKMPFPDAAFSAAISLTMLHHVPTRLQDRLLGEACRVLKPGGVFVGIDSTPSFVWNLYHLFDDRFPVDPDGFGARLERAGFGDVSVRRNPGRPGFSFRARRPPA
ncbi:MAG TPA: class I SAM-dependent methyltransferase [Dehalococcoidia bacterium]|nr:class I SAM-dependent methyltransferase [Dehalococcoidia bacterium]